MVFGGICLFLWLVIEMSGIDSSEESCVFIGL